MSYFTVWIICCLGQVVSYFVFDDLQTCVASVLGTGLGLFIHNIFN